MVRCIGSGYLTECPLGMPTLTLYVPQQLYYVYFKKLYSFYDGKLCEQWLFSFTCVFPTQLRPKALYTVHT